MTDAQTVEDDVDDEEGEGTSFAAQVRAFVMGMTMVPFIVTSPILSAIPPAWRLYHKIHKWSAYQMQKAASADTLANVRLSNGHEDVRPAGWVEGDEDEKDRTGWKVSGLGDKRYDGAVHGRSTTRLGKANMIHINEDDTEQATWAEATIDNAFQLNREQYLFRDATISMVTMEQTGPMDGARADGGQQVHNVSVERPGVLHDALVPVGSRTGYDGQVISWNQYSSLKSEQSDQEAIRQTKNSAWTAAKLDTEQGADMLKWFLILGAVGFILLFHQEIGALIAGFGGGGGGGGGVGGAASDALGMMAPAGFGGV